MPDLKISQLPVASATTGAELFPVVQGGVTRRIALNNVQQVGTLTSLGVSGVTTLSAGTDVAPALTTTGDTNTGIFFPAADTFGIATGGFSRFRVTATGDVLINTVLSGTAGLVVSNSQNISFGETGGNSVANLFRQSNSAALVLANGYKYTATANGYASSTGNSWARTAIRMDDGIIRFLTDTALTVANGTDMTPTERMRLDSSGNLGLGVTPSAWVTYKAIDLPLSGALFARGTGDGSGLAQNAFLASGGIWTYKRSTFASFYEQVSGTHAWFTAPSGTAGNAITLTERLRVDATTTAGQTALLLWDVDNGTLERVTVGAADSAGAGFKVLRIPN